MALLEGRFVELFSFLLGALWEPGISSNTKCLLDCVIAPPGRGGGGGASL